jgi:iron(II)-dependent oxidoreductase
MTSPSVIRVTDPPCLGQKPSGTGTVLFDSPMGKSRSRFEFLWLVPKGTLPATYDFHARLGRLSLHQEVIGLDSEILFYLPTTSGLYDLRMGTFSDMTVLASMTSRHAELEEMLSEARERTLSLVRGLTHDDLTTQHDPLMSPVVWDLAHIASFEKLWLTRNLDGPVEFVEMPGLFNPMEHPRSERGQLSLPDLDECEALMRDIRLRVLRQLSETDLDSGPRLARDGYVYHLVLQHEYQHNETILQTLQLKLGGPYYPPTRRSHPVASFAVDPGRMVSLPGGDMSIGTGDRITAYDNERPQHTVTIAPFAIDVFPVSNGDFARFMEQGGYDNPVYWSEAGREWLGESQARSPLYWSLRDGVWWTRTLDREAPIEPDHPVCHVNYHEAEAYAKSVGKRLPTEFEWEAAATWNPVTGSSQRFPWGDQEPSPALANVDQLGFGTAPLGSYPHNVSPLGCYGMIGDVWEWTASTFHGYPGFQVHPYPEYSEVFFGSEYRVLRGGSWATRSGAIRGTFRNWDYPIRRQIFSGFRCARDG